MAGDRLNYKRDRTPEPDHSFIVSGDSLYSRRSKNVLQTFFFFFFNIFSHKKRFILLFFVFIVIFTIFYFLLLRWEWSVGHCELTSVSDSDRVKFYLGDEKQVSRKFLCKGLSMKYLRIFFFSGRRPVVHLIQHLVAGLTVWHMRASK